MSLFSLQGGASWGELSFQSSSTEENDDHKEGILMSYCHIVNYLLENYATNDRIAEAEADVMNYNYPENISAGR